MRPDDCRELANHSTPEAIARHLEVCPTCAQASKLDRIWEATRAAEPSPEVLDALWARASAQLDRIEAARLTPKQPVVPIPGRRRVFAWVALAQAAVILVAVGITQARRGADSRRPQSIRERSAPVVDLAADPLPFKEVVDVGFDETLIVRIGDDGHRDRVDKLVDPSVFPALADNSAHDVFNALESMSNP